MLSSRSSEICGEASSHNVQTKTSWVFSYQWKPCWVASWYLPLGSDSSVKWEFITQSTDNFPVDMFFFFFLHPQWKAAEATTIINLYSCGWILGSSTALSSGWRYGEWGKKEQQKVLWVSVAFDSCGPSIRYILKWHLLFSLFSLPPEFLLTEPFPLLRCKAVLTL